MSLTVPLEEIAACLEGVIPSPFATCGPDGTPNVTYLSIVRRLDAEHVALSFQFFSKTRRNLEANPRAQVIVVDPASLRQYRLDLRFERSECSGALFESMRTQLGAIASQTGMARVFVLRGVDVYRVLACEPIGQGAAPAAGPGLDALQALERFTRRLSAFADLEGFFTGALEALFDAFGYEHAFLLLHDQARACLYTIASRGYERSGVGSEIALGQGLLGVAARARTLVRNVNLARDLAYSRAVRASLHEHEESHALEREIPLPGLASVVSQLAVPLVAQDQLVGLLCLQSERPGRFLESDARLVEIAARSLGATLALLQADTESAGAPPAGATLVAEPAPGRAVLRHYRSDDSVFLDDVYLIKGVAGRILWRLCESHVSDGRREFSNKEIRLDQSLQLPDLKDNLETRLILLRRRLEERCEFLRVNRTGRGRFELVVGRRLELVELP